MVFTVSGNGAAHQQGMTSLISSSTANTSVANRSRVPDGFRNGGEFTTERSQEAVLTARPSRLGNFAEILDEDQVALLAAASKSTSRFWVSRKEIRSGQAGFGTDVSDISQETALRVLESIEKLGKAPTNLSSYTMTISRRVVSDTSPTGRRNWEIVSANAQLNKWKEEFRTESNREANRNEIDGQKHIIIASFDEKHRPAWDFDDANGRLAPIALEAEQVNNLATANFPGSDYEDESFDPASPMGEAISAVIEKDLAAAEVALRPNENGETKVREKMAAMRRMSWNAFAEARDNLPEMQPKHINPRHASVIRAAVEASGGVAAVCAQWSEVGDSDATEALFAPFGKLSFEEQESVVDFLTSKQVGKFENGAETLWGHAITGATNRKRSGD
jgi:DNA-directed RNA polymerase specialized sigma24 family protein